MSLLYGRTTHPRHCEPPQGGVAIHAVSCSRCVLPLDCRVAPLLAVTEDDAGRRGGSVRHSIRGHRGARLTHSRHARDGRGPPLAAAVVCRPRGSGSWIGQWLPDCKARHPQTRRFAGSPNIWNDGGGGCACRLSADTPPILVIANRRRRCGNPCGGAPSMRVASGLLRRSAPRRLWGHATLFLPVFVPGGTLAGLDNHSRRAP